MHKTTSTPNVVEKLIKRKRVPSKKDSAKTFGCSPAITPRFMITVDPKNILKKKHSRFKAWKLQSAWIPPPGITVHCWQKMLLKMGKRKKLFQNDTKTITVL